MERGCPMLVIHAVGSGIGGQEVRIVLPPCARERCAFWSGDKCAIVIIAEHISGRKNADETNDRGDCAGDRTREG